MSGHFFSKFRALFLIFGKGQGRPPVLPPLVTRLKMYCVIFPPKK